MKGPNTYRSFILVLLAAGAEIERNASGHEQWRLPNGRRFTLPSSRGSWGDRHGVLNRWRDLRHIYPAIVRVWEGHQ